jgi:hypothetical protein
VWRLLSGFEHGTGWALVHGSDSVVEADVEGGKNVQFVMKDEAFVNAAKTAYFMLVSACRTYIGRCSRP